MSRMVACSGVSSRSIEASCLWVGRDRRPGAARRGGAARGRKLSRCKPLQDSNAAEGLSTMETRGGGSGLRLNQPEIPVLAAVEHGDLPRGGVAEDQELLLGAADLQERFLHRHRLEGGGVDPH